MVAAGASDENLLHFCQADSGHKLSVNAGTVVWYVAVLPGREYPVELLIVCGAAFAASLLTLFSGFGLGTLLMPVIAIFFPLDLAIAMTALVHLANNLFKFVLLGRQANVRLLWQFGLPAVLAALAGAWLLSQLGAQPALCQYSMLSQHFEILPIKLVVGVLIIVFVLLELSPRFATVQLAPQWLPLGGLISGFFGGLSGHQGALRTMFLRKTGLDKNAFVATTVVLAVMVDLARMAVYGSQLPLLQVDWSLVLVACIAAFAGAYLGKKLLQKTTLATLQLLVSMLLLLLAVALIAGWL